jgi:phosphoenolpyruvate-protein kinase (PTS system EI component)
MDPETVADFERKPSAQVEEQAGMEEYRHVEASTIDRRHIEVSANLGSPKDAEDALTNDRVQYTLAADRGNEKLRHLQSADHPAVRKLIEETCQVARESRVYVGM